MRRKVIAGLVLMLGFVLGHCSAAVREPSLVPEIFVFTSFRGNGEDGLHLATSRDGYLWTAVNRDRALLRSELGAKLIRDPCVAHGPDGVFHLVWTTGWTVDQGKVFGYARSTNLIHWSQPRAVEVMQNEPGTRNVWAPEIFWDNAQGQWLVIWSSTIPGKFAETDQSGDDRYNHRIYAVRTKDFRQFSPSQLFYDPGFNCIDATLLRVEKKFYLIFKDERKTPLQKVLRYATADRAEGPFGAASEPFTRNWVEGPSAIKIGDEYFVYFDHYPRPQYYGAVKTKDFAKWEDVSHHLNFPRDHRHGTVIRVEPAIGAALEALAPERP